MKLIIASFLILSLTACSMVRKPATAPQSKSAQSAAAIDEATLYAILGAIKPAQDEYNDKKMAAGVTPAFSQAVNSYNAARQRWIVYRQAVDLNTRTDYAGKEFRTALDKAVVDIAAMQRLRGMNP